MHSGEEEQMEQLAGKNSSRISTERKKSKKSRETQEAKDKRERHEDPKRLEEAKKDHKEVAEIRQKEMPSSKLEDTQEVNKRQSPKGRGGMNCTEDNRN